MKVRALPTCRNPVGDGANRTRSITFEYSGRRLWVGWRQLARRCRKPCDYRGITKVTGPQEFTLALPHLIKRYSLTDCLTRRAQGGTCRKTPVVSSCRVWQE